MVKKKAYPRRSTKVNEILLMAYKKHLHTNQSKRFKSQRSQNMSIETRSNAKAIKKPYFLSHANLLCKFINPQALECNLPLTPNSSTIEFLKNLFTADFIKKLVDPNVSDPLTGKILLLPNIFPDDYQKDRFEFKNNMFHLLVTKEIQHFIATIIGYKTEYGGIFAFEARYNLEAREKFEQEESLNEFYHNFDSHRAQFLLMTSGAGKSAAVYLLVCLLHGWCNSKGVPIASPFFLPSPKDASFHIYQMKLYLRLFYCDLYEAAKRDPSVDFIESIPEKNDVDFISFLDVSQGRHVQRLLVFLLKNRPNTVIIVDQLNNIYDQLNKSKNIVVVAQLEILFYALRMAKIPTFVTSSANITSIESDLLKGYEKVSFDAFQYKVSSENFDTFVALQLYLFNYDVESSVHDEDFKRVLLTFVSDYSSCIPLHIRIFLKAFVDKVKKNELKSVEDLELFYSDIHDNFVKDVTRNYIEFEDKIEYSKRRQNVNEKAMLGCFFHLIFDSSADVSMDTFDARYFMKCYNSDKTFFIVPIYRFMPRIIAQQHAISRFLLDFGLQACLLKVSSSGMGAIFESIFYAMITVGNYIPFIGKDICGKINRIEWFFGNAPNELSEGITFYKPNSSNYQTVDFVVTDYQSIENKCKIIFIQFTIEKAVDSKQLKILSAFVDSDTVLSNEIFYSWFSLFMKTGISADSIAFEFILMYAQHNTFHPTDSCMKYVAVPKDVEQFIFEGCKTSQ